MGGRLQAFKTDSKYPSYQAELKELLSEDEFKAARRTTINAHYTNPVYVAAMWQMVRDLGFDGGRVLRARLRIRHVPRHGTRGPGRRRRRRRARPHLELASLPS